MSRMQLPFYQVDAFSSGPFGGNPAAVVLLSTTAANNVRDELLQAIAEENNLAETAFIQTHPEHVGDAQEPFSSCAHFKLRWFTPKTEVPLCGHATLAAAAVLIHGRYQVQVWEPPSLRRPSWCSRECGNRSATIHFHTLSGVLEVTQDLEMALPLAEPADPVPQGCGDVDGPLARACTGGLKVREVLFTRASGLDYLVLLLEEGVTREQLEAMQPNMEAMQAAAAHGAVRGVIVTTHGGSAGPDILSRFFAPWMGIPEDHVTGSAHAVLGPLWQGRLGKDVMTARQCSARGGDLTVRVERGKARVVLSGTATVVIRGTMSL